MTLLSTVTYGLLRASVAGAALIGLTAASAPPAGRPEPVDLELVIATDSSGSIGDEEAHVQRQGVAAAFRSEELAKVLSLGVYGKIAVAYLDWSNQFDNTVVVDWTIIKDKASAAAFADQLESLPRTYGRRTSISSAIVSGMDLLEGNAYEGTRRTIDISGDGPNNFGLSLAPVREEAIAKGITINGLPIILEGTQWERNSFAEIDKYYANCVIGGRGAFAIIARGYNDFARAVRRKLILEISGVEPETQYAQALLPVRNTRLDFAQVRELPPPPGMLRAPAVREQNCDVQQGGWGFYR
jgi:hypothetical protein